MRLTLNNIILRYRSWLLIVIFFAGISIFFTNNGHVYLNYENALIQYNELKDSIQKDTQKAHVIFFLLYLFIVTFSLPFASFLTIVGSALFGWEALLIILFSASIGACFPFIAARTILSDWFYRKTHAHKSIIRPNFEENAFFLLLGLRLIPIAPFWIVNILPAFTTISLTSFFSATFVGIMPGTMLYVWLGNRIDDLLSRGEWPNMINLIDSKIWMPLAGLGLLILATATFRLLERKFIRKMDNYERN